MNAIIITAILLLGFTGRRVLSRPEAPKIAIFQMQARDTLSKFGEECESEATVRCNASFSLDVIRINRLFNPPSHTRYLHTFDMEYLDKNKYYTGALQDLQVEVRPRSRYRQPGSRALEYKSLHVKFGVLTAPDMMSRFCEWADLAKEEGLERVLTIDSDVAIFDDVQKLLAPFQEDIVSTCYWCSQVVLWNTKALDAFCDGLIEFWKMPADEIIKLLLKYKMIHLDDKQKNGITFMDMYFLRIYHELRWWERQGHKFTWLDLTGSGGQPSPRIPHPGAWLYGWSLKVAYPLVMDPAHWLKGNDGYRNYNMECENADKLVEFKTTTGSQIPIPFDKQSGVQIPMIHFQTKCKHEFAHKVYLEHYHKWCARTVVRSQ